MYKFISFIVYKLGIRIEKNSIMEMIHLLKCRSGELNRKSKTIVSIIIDITPTYQSVLTVNSLMFYESRKSN